MGGICSGASFPDCTADTLSPDPDIAGIGVILSFVIINGLTVIVTAISLLFISLEDLRLKGVDLALHKWLKRRGLKPLSKILSNNTIKFWIDILEKILLGDSDTQLLTGIAILAAGYIKCSISVYHSTIVADLAWFASGTNLSSLQVLRHYLFKHPATKILRVILLLVTFGLLLSLTLYQGNQEWFDSDVTPAQCLFADGVSNVGGYPAFWMGFNIFFIVLGYGPSIVDLFPEYVDESSAIIKGYVHVMEKSGDTIKKLWSNIQSPSGESKAVAGGNIVLSFIGLVLLGIVWLIMGFFFLMIDSYFVAAIFDIFWFAFGLFNLILDRNYGQSFIDPDDIVLENQWGFGQVVPMLLVLLPIMTAWEVWYGMCSPPSCKRATVD